MFQYRLLSVYRFGLTTKLYIYITNDDMVTCWGSEVVNKEIFSFLTMVKKIK